MNFLELAELTEDEAREHIEALRWPKGARCPHCESENVGRIEAGKSTKTRKGLWQCYNTPECGQQFTVTVGTVLESSHVPLKKWLLAFHLMASSKKGMSAHQIHRTLKITYKTAWFLTHRIRLAMQDSIWLPLKGIVEVDETFVGGKPRRGVDAPGVSKKTPVLALVERGGKARTMALQKVTGKDLKERMRENIEETARIMTDESPNYKGTAKHFASHETVNHSAGDYAHGDVTTNSAESFFSLMKRQHYGTHHHYSVKHLPKYVRETEFRWNRRGMTDEERRDSAITGAEGKRLMYRDSSRRD